MRGFWFTAGAAAGVYGVVKARRIVEAFTVDGMRDRVGAVFVGARMFREEVAQGKADAEVQLRERFRAAADGPPELAAGSPAPAIETTSTEEGTS
ncbi:MULTISPECIES: DUF6167 family protein [Nocardioides]|uniref:DUF6167 family protein n=1 Tax=Nocardioides vastitatis TaxID=2568655 RepID=A0ABW0ZGH1_9ACTN|nr:DUF6167 family protein [Nocardioides sp.]THJ07818.1 hypothetical protein E7Z54_05270 [Nocardioides sp.]